MMWTQNFSWWMWILMAAGTIGFWALVVVAVRELAGSGRSAQESPTEAARVLDERLARGEIDSEQYERTRQLLLRHR